jgi:hypothetical protein
LIAEVVPSAQDLATKADLHAETTRTIKWMLGSFISLCLGTWGSWPPSF